MNLGILKDILPEMRRRNIAKEKKKNWIRWFAGVLKRKGYQIDLNICAYGQKQIVDKVVKVGNAYLIKSKACGGCSGGQIVINYTASNDPKNTLRGPIPCALLQNYLIHDEEVKENQIIDLNRI